MSKLLLTALTLVLIAAGATAVLAATGDGPSTPATVDLTTGAASERDDDSADDRGDDRDRGRDHPEDDGTLDDHDGVADDNPSADDLSDVDISGNCDEAEHAADPECQGIAAGTTTADDDHGVDDDGGFDDDDAFEDNSGPSVNSGPGSVSSGSGSSGEGSSGHGGDDD